MIETIISIQKYDIYNIYIYTHTVTVINLKSKFIFTNDIG